MARRDRCGAQISEELLVYGYCTRQGLEYLGPVGPHHFELHHRLCGLLGLPLPVAELPQAWRDAVLVEPEDYGAERYPDENVLVGGTFRQQLRERVAHLLRKPAGLPLTAALHLRRGDVQPTGRWADRYLPNAYFLDLLRKLRQRCPSLHATVYSESRSAESFDEFRALGCDLRLDADIGETWVEMMRADVLVMSMSGFSWVPALYNPNLVLYAPCWYMRLEPWVDSSDPQLDAHLDRFFAWRAAGKPHGPWTAGGAQLNPA